MKGPLRYSINALIFFLFTLLTAIGCHAQGNEVTPQGDAKGLKDNNPPTTNDVFKGNTYALVVGISKYQNFPSLKYADRDAQEFYNFLISPAGGSIPEKNIYKLLNDSATAINMVLQFGELESLVKKGDRVVIYFSGHGDAKDLAQSYLLCYNAPPPGNRNMYLVSGTYPVYSLKMEIRKLAAADAKVYFIIDACRTQPTEGNDANGTLFKSIETEDDGDAMMISCSEKEQSEEGEAWGGGRGVFSYYLTEGLNGKADVAPKDGKVSFDEIERFVKDSVTNATMSPTLGKARQRPYFKCPEELSGLKLAVVDASNQTTTAQLVKPHLLKGIVSNETAMKGGTMDSTVLNNINYKNFQASLSSKRYLSPEDNSSKYWLDKLIAGINDKHIETSLKDEFVIRLVNEAQNYLNNYLKGYDYNYDEGGYFNTPALYLKCALGYMNPGSSYYKQLNTSRLFFEARAARASNDTQVLHLGLQKIDSALIGNEGYAFLHHTKGLLLKKLGKKPEALVSFKKACQLAPEWKYPINMVGAIYNEMGQNDSAIKYYQRAITLDDKYADAYCNLGRSYFESEDRRDAETAYLKAIAVNPNMLESYWGLEKIYNYPQMIDSAISLARKSLVIDSMNYYSFKNIAYLFEQKAIYDSDINNYHQAINYYNKCLKIDSTRYELLPFIANDYYILHDYHAAISYYISLVAKDSNDTASYYQLSCCYARVGNAQEAIKNLELAFQKGFNDRESLENDLKPTGDLYSIRDQVKGLSKSPLNKNVKE